MKRSISQNYKAKLLLVALACVGFMSCYTVIFAQEPTQTPIVLPETETVLENYAKRWEARFAQLSLSDVNVIYLVNSSALSEASTATAEVFAEHLYAEIVDSWDDVESIIAQEPIDILIIHESALGMADSEWVSAAYRNGTMIVGISVAFEDLTAIAGDACVKNESPTISRHFTEWYIYLVYWAVVTPIEGKAIVDTETLANCSGNYEGLIGAVTAHGARIHPITNAASIEYLADVILGDIVSRELQGVPLPSQVTVDMRSLD
ncbi:MAG: hypothetical protein IPK52_23180 [Chloroflexi bacterium]|nr:hypothetical protein [Chloroflexota bacterium]